MKPMVLFLLAAGLAAQSPLPLPDAPLRLLIPDVAAFDAALTGPYRQFLAGDPSPQDPVVAAWRRTQVGSKLEAQWSRFSGDLPWTWETLKKLQARSMGLALLDVGHLEAVLVVETPLAQLPVDLPQGERRTHGGVAYGLVTRGAADGNEDPDRRMGLAWARLGGRLILATSERALLKSLDEAQAGHGFAAAMPGLAVMELDLEALRKDRYFRREFLFAEGPEKGRLRAALRQEAKGLVEVREGQGEPRPGVFSFPVPAFAAAGWEPAGEPFWPAFRRGLLEPIPVLGDLPVPGLAALPAAGAEAQEDRYAVDLTRPALATGGPAWEAGDLAAWSTLLARQPIPSFGFWVTPDGVRRLAFPWPAAQDAQWIEACRASIARRAGRAMVVTAEGIHEIRVGPGLPALALRRTGPVLWAAPCAKDLKDLPEPRPEADLVRWAKVDLEAVRREGTRWRKIEGPARPEQVRPFSDRILGLLGWMPATRTFSVERRRTAQGWTERVVFGAPQ